MDRPYGLPLEDEQYLDAHYPRSWERRVEGSSKWGLFVHEFRIPIGYDRARSTLMVLVPTGYPGAALDMFYFAPHLARGDGQGIGALADEVHFGVNWQRWSRHYEWHPGEDNLCRHIEYVKRELETELQR